VRDLLSAYLDGTLSDQQKVYVAGRLATSASWQRELDRLTDVRRQLSNEMPLVGRPLDGQLAALLPEILEDAQSTNRIDFRTLLKRTLMGGTLLLTVLILPAIFMQLNGPAHAAVEYIENVPSVTNTPAAQKESTFEPITVVRNEFQYSFVRFASPVPQPGATLEPSLEARNNSRP
jgi:hypothetical protein